MKKLIILFMMFLLNISFANAVTFREDNTILVDGKPFFPIGLYYCYEEFEDHSGALMKELKDYGFNTLGFYRAYLPSWKEEMDMADKLAMKVWVRGPQGFIMYSDEMETGFVEQIKKMKDHPALLFWEYEDEPLGNGVSPEKARKSHTVIKREDPDHPILTVECPSEINRLHEWNGIGDMYAIDLYPIPRELGYGKHPNKDITQIRDYIDAIKKARGEKSPILMALQAWSWNPLKYGKRGYPTVTESRFMAYQAVIHGAKGLHYYGQFHCTKPNPADALSSDAKDPGVNKAEFEKCLELNKWFFGEHGQFFKELNDATGIFVLKDAENNIEVIEGKSIESRIKQNGDALYLMTVNASNEKTQAKFQLPAPCKSAEIFVLFENRKITVNDGMFVDSFEPYGAHIYATVRELP